MEKCYEHFRKIAKKIHLCTKFQKIVLLIGSLKFSIFVAFYHCMFHPLFFSETPYNLDTYPGRFRHFFRQQNPLNVLATAHDLENAKRLYKEFPKDKSLEKNFGEKFAKENYPPAFWEAKYLYDSAYHPTTGEMLIFRVRKKKLVFNSYFLELFRIF